MQDLTVSVNLSTRQLMQADLLTSVNRILERTELPAQNLKLEITETAMLQDMENTIPRLQALRNMGIRIAMDDFGTGYSSMSYLNLLPLDTLKIDRAFVQKIGSTEDADAIVKTMVNLGKMLGLKVTSEGIETNEQSDYVSSLGCDNGQGYLFARPLNDLALEDFIVGYAEAKPSAPQDGVARGAV